MKLFNYDRLHLGCGAIFVGGWLNVDLFEWDKELPYGESKKVKHAELLKFDVTRDLPVRPASVKYIYASHLIEHLEVKQGLEFLIKCRNYLTDEGIIRLAYPDLAIFVQKYIQKDRNFFENRKNKIASFVGFDLNSDANAISEICYNWGHKWMYDGESLSELLRIANFSDIETKKLHESEIPDITLLEYSKKEDHTGYLEAKK